jgi:hypothetical protein
MDTDKEEPLCKVESQQTVVETYNHFIAQRTLNTHTPKKKMREFFSQNLIFVWKINPISRVLTKNAVWKVGTEPMRLKESTFSDEKLFVNVKGPVHAF